MGPEIVEIVFPGAFRLLAGAYALIGAYVALAVGRSIPTGCRAHAWRSIAGTALAVATGTWCMHYAMIAASPLPFTLETALVVGALLAPLAAATASLAWQDAAGGPVPLLRRAGAAIVLAAGLLATPLVGVQSMGWTPAIAWDEPMLATACLLALAAALAFLTTQCWLAKARGRRVSQRLLGAVAMALPLLGADLAVLAAAQLPEAAVSQPHWALDRDGMAVLLLVTGPAVLVLLAFTASMEARMRQQIDRGRDELQQAETTDSLTRLPNRRRFEERLQAAAMRADRHQQRMAVLCINVDGLKTINESFGPAAGDALLCGMAQRLQHVAGDHDMVARAGGDEFLMLLGANRDRDAVARVAERVISRLSEPLMPGAREVGASCSVGIAMYPEDGAMSTLVTRASAATRTAKRNGRATYCFFEANMVESARDHADLLRDLRHAVERRELELFYQPKIHAATGQLTGAEALLRWRHASRGVVSPAVFVPLAERAGLIGVLGNWVIEEACRQMQAWRDKGLRIRVSINLSVHQLRQPDLARRIRAALVRHQIEPMQLTCEITESAAMDDTGTTLALVQELAAAGVHLSIDDFGTGYSSLSYLRRLPAAELKIDRSFVFDLGSSQDACAIVDAVIKLAHALGLKVVAEGVETEAQRAILCGLGCDELQGFLFAKPMVARVLSTWVNESEIYDEPAAAPRLPAHGRKPAPVSSAGTGFA